MSGNLMFELQLTMFIMLAIGLMTLGMAMGKLLAPMVLGLFLSTQAGMV